MANLIAYALTTLVRLKLHIGVSGSSDDVELERIINAVTDFIENRCNRRFKKTAYTSEIHDGDGSNILLLKQYPVVAGQTFTIYERQTADNENSWDALDSEDYFVKNDEGIVEANFNFGVGIQNYKVLYTAGLDFDNTTKYLSDAGASDLEMAVWELCKAFYMKRKDDPTIQSLTLGNYSVVFNKILEKNNQIAEIINKYIKYE